MLLARLDAVKLILLRHKPLPLLRALEVEVRARHPTRGLRVLLTARGVVARRRRSLVRGLKNMRAANVRREKWLRGVVSVDRLQRLHLRLCLRRLWNSQLEGTSTVCGLVHQLYALQLHRTAGAVLGRART